MREKIAKVMNSTCFTLLMDRGFCNVNCLIEAGRGDTSLITPATRTPGIKKKVELFKEGKIGPMSEYTMKNAAGREVTFTLVIVKGYDKEGNEKHLTFARNLPFTSTDEMPSFIPKTYRQRWCIETGYRVMKRIMARTCSNSLAMRLLLFYLPVLLYNLWRIVKASLAGTCSRRA